jgi:hypothetical protein
VECARSEQIQEDRSTSTLDRESSAAGVAN